MLELAFFIVLFLLLAMIVIPAAIFIGYWVFYILWALATSRKSERTQK